MKIAISTSGGDAPGLNAVIHAAVRTAHHLGHTVVGLKRGFSDLLDGGAPVDLTDTAVEGIERTGGTILGAESRGNPFRGDPDGLERIVDTLRRHGVEALIMAGGDGTMKIANEVHAAGLPVVGVPKTIDRDVCHTRTTFGFETAVDTATQAIDRLHSTSASHSRLMVVEVMGRDAGWIALHSGIATSACGIAIPEIPYRTESFATEILRREAAGYDYHMIVCAEGAREAGSDGATHARTGRYGGVAEILATDIEAITGKESRSISLGHLLRGGPPTARDRLLGIRFGSEAVASLDRGESGVMIAYQPPGFSCVPLAEVAGRIAPVPHDAHEIRVARAMGISFGD